MRDPPVLVVGGGIAGLATALHLARRGVRACVLEREPVLAAHASGRNAAIFRHVDGDPRTTRLALRSRKLLAALAAPGALLRRTGALYLGGAPRVRALAALARASGIAADFVAGARSLSAHAPALAGGACDAGLLVPADGLLDVHALVAAVAREARERGVEIRTGTPVHSLVAERGTVVGARLEDGGVLRAPAVVVAAGAWAGELGATCGAGVALQPLRRHLVLLDAPASEAGGLVVWAVEPRREVYFRAEGGGLLASPCDEDPWPPVSPPAASDAGERLADRLAPLAPGLLDARLGATWACLRTFAPDRGFVAGADATRRRLYWLAGLGGRGMTCGLALGEALARRIARRIARDRSSRRERPGAGRRSRPAC